MRVRGGAARMVLLRVSLLALLAACVLIVACDLDDPFQQQGDGRVFDGTLRLSVTMGEDDPRTQGAKHFARLVEKYSQGALHCKVTTGMELGSDVDLIKKMMRDTGEVDMIIVSSAYFGEHAGIPQIEIPSMPYLLTDYETAWAFADSGIMARFEEGLPERNMRVLTHFCGGFRCLTNSKRPITAPEDLKGLVIRTPAGSMVMDMLFALDAKAMPLPFAELHDALAKGYYDGQENPPSIIYQNGLYDAQDYLSVTNHCYMMQSFTIAESTWQQLSGEERSIVMRAAEEAKMEERKLVATETEHCIRLLESEGMEVNYPDLSLFREATEDFRKQRSHRYGADYAEVKEWLERREADKADAN